MLTVRVKESPRAIGKPRVRRARWIGVTVVAVVALSLVICWLIVLPHLLRGQVESALRAAGVRGISFTTERATPWGSTLTNIKAGTGESVGIQRVVLDYSPIDLWNGKLDAIQIVGGRVELTVRDGRVDFSPLAQFIARSKSAKAPSTTRPSVPVSRIELTNSNLVIKTERNTTTVPIDITVVSEGRGDRLVFDTRLGPNRNMI